MLTASQLTNFDRDGFVVARQLITPGEVQTIRSAFMTANADGPVPGLSETEHKTGGKYTTADPLNFYPRMMHPHLHPDKPVGVIAKQYLLDSRIRTVLAELMREEPFAVQTMFYFKPPGARGQSLHQDNYYLRVKPGTCMAAWIAIDDCDEGNGGMACVPRTATLDIKCPERADATTSFTTEYVHPPNGATADVVDMKAGDVLFFNGNTIHGSGPNRSTRFRRSLICHYVPQSTTEMSDWYKAFGFDGTLQPIQQNQDGGPCGTPHRATTVH